MWQRDPQELLESPPSSRRPQRVGYRFATIAALVRFHRYPLSAASALVDAWERYVRYAMASGKPPESTADHLVRFERHQAAPWGGRRDPQGRVPRDAIDQAIADDLRARAREIAREDPEHARELRLQADALDPDPARDPQRSSRPRSKAKGTDSRSPGRTASQGQTRRGGLRARTMQVSAQGIPFEQCPRGTRLQALMLPKARYSLATAVRFAEAHGFFLAADRDGDGVPDNVEASKNWIRVSLVPSGLFERRSFRNILLSERYELRGVIGCPRVEIAGRGRRGVQRVVVPELPAREREELTPQRRRRVA